LDVRSGEVLAAVSLPDFDPHDPGAASKESLFNRVTLGVYEPGSIFKVFSTAALLEFENAPMYRTYDVREPLERGRHTIRDFHPEKRILSLPEVFMLSSNIGSAMMGEQVGTDRLRAFYADLGLLDPQDIEIPEQGRPLVPEPWREINTLTASYGHGIAVTPLQMTSAVASVIGDGTLVTPRFVIEGGGADFHDKAMQKPDLRIVRPQTAHRMRQLLRLVVTDGTGGKARVPGFQVGGKTGTAEKPGRGGYRRDKLLSSFIGVFPMSAPRYAVMIMIDEPKGTAKSFGYATGGWVAAPAAQRVIASMAPLLSVPVAPLGPDETDRLVAPLLRHVKKEKEGEKIVSY
jgi:cell division protein FtsI (penicillin-binding protein 3)